MSESEAGQVSGCLSITNSHEDQTTLAIEPWGEEFPVAPRETLVVEYVGPASGYLEIEVTPARIIVYGWTGSIVEVRPKAQ